VGFDKTSRKTFQDEEIPCAGYGEEDSLGSPQFKVISLYVQDARETAYTLKILAKEQCVYNLVMTVYYYIPDKDVHQILLLMELPAA